MSSNINTQSHMHLKTTIGGLIFDVWFNHDFTTPFSVRNVGSHNHSLYEVHYIIGGSGTLFVGHEEYPLTPNSLHIIGPGIYHSFRSHTRDPLFRSYLQFFYKHPRKNRSDRDNESESAKIEAILQNIQYISHGNVSRHIQWIAEIHHEIANRRIGYYARVHSLITLILLDLIREVEPNSRVTFTPPKLTKDDLRSMLIDDFFDQYSEPLTIQDLAASLNLSTKQTNRIIMERYQTTFKQKLLDTRIEVAKNLLTATDLSVQDIFERVGYSLHRSFSRVFKRKTGYSPLEYRHRYGASTSPPPPDKL